MGMVEGVVNVEVLEEVEVEVEGVTVEGVGVEDLKRWRWRE